MFPMTFDWSQIAYIGSPLVTPFWAALNIVGGLILVMWIAAPIMCESSLMRSRMAATNTSIRLLQRHVLLLHAHTLLCSLRQHR